MFFVYLLPAIIIRNAYAKITIAILQFKQCSNISMTFLNEFWWLLFVTATKSKSKIVDDCRLNLSIHTKLWKILSPLA